MPSDSTLKLTLIFICIFLHFFNAAGLFYSHPFPAQLYDFNGEQIDLLEISAKASFLLRIVGACFLGKVADKIGFVKVMKIIFLLNILAGLLLACFDIPNVFAQGTFLCFLRSLFAFLRVSCCILPIIYVFRHYEKLKYYRYSAFMWTSSIAGIMAANLCFNIFAHTLYVNWGLIYALNGILCFIIYSCIGTVPELKIKKALQPISKPAFLLAFLLAGILGVSISYQYFYIQHYAADVMILKTSGQQIIYSPFWITLLLTIIPMAYLTKNLNFSQVLYQLLIGVLFSVSILYIFPSLNKVALFFHKITFGVFFGLFLPPALVLIYRLLQGHNSYFYVSWVLCSSTSCFMLITMYLEKLRFISSPLVGASLLILLILSCLWINHYFCLSSNNTQEKAKPAWLQKALIQCIVFKLLIFEILAVFPH